MWCVLFLFIGMAVGAFIVACKEPENNYDYASVQPCGIDGCLREHAFVRETVYTGIGEPNKLGRILCKIHLPKRDRETTLEVENKELTEQLKVARERIVYLESLYNS